MELAQSSFPPCTYTVRKRGLEEDTWPSDEMEKRVRFNSYTAPVVLTGDHGAFTPCSNMTCRFR